MNVLVAGGSGFVGRHVVPALLERGHDVRVMTRSPGERDDGAVEVFGDIAEPLTIAGAMHGIDVAVYLVHTLDHPDFAERDRVGAENFGRQAAESGLDHVVYLGGLGNDGDELSEHLRSRREVEEILTAALPTIALRAAIVVGQGSVSWEILCQLVERLPVMVTPRWVQTRTQPIALDDVVAYLVAAVEMTGVSDHFEIGAPDAMTYNEMLKSVAQLQDRSIHILPVPVLSPTMSSYWLRLVTDVDLQTARSLVDSMANEVVVTDRRFEERVGRPPTPFLDAARIALKERSERAAPAEPADA
ncbi:MAG: NAD-dependent epimerase/dehydratase family protein [Ilumatobacteraceae bacterium]|nr:NAD-dependent epimerase/dehydratase family protein [Ilumatobacteraceae bacterium]